MKYLIVLLIVIAAAGTASAQAIFKPLPKLQGYHVKERLGLAADSSMNALRFITNIAAYAYDKTGSRLMAGAGLSWQKLSWDQATANWYCKFSISGMMWAGGTIAPSQPSPLLSYGVIVGILNNTITFGPEITGKNLGATIGIAINLNNGIKVL